MDAYEYPSCSYIVDAYEYASHSYLVDAYEYASRSYIVDAYEYASRLYLVLWGIKQIFADTCRTFASVFYLVCLFSNSRCPPLLPLPADAP